MTDVLSAATSAVTAALSSLPSKEEIDVATSMQLIEAMNQLRAALEPPSLAIINLCISHYGLIAIRVGQGMGIFDAFDAVRDTKGLTADELNKKTKGDKALLVRVMSQLCAHNIFKEIGKEKYQALPIALALGLGAPPDDAVKHFYLNMRTSTFLYEYFEEKGYSNPSDAFDSPFQYAHATKDHCFDWLSRHPQDQDAFNSVMRMSRIGSNKSWYQFYPVEEKLQVHPERVILVDIGGGVGHDVSDFKMNFPNLPGRLVLQDLPQAIAGIQSPLPDGIETMSYNMFDTQPVKNAKAYYMRTVLHDWPDKQALEALAKIREAMAKDSILLINENTLADTNVSQMAAAVDFVMMETFSSMERTEQQWTSLLARAGFKVKVWRADNDHQVSYALYEALPIEQL